MITLEEIKKLLFEFVDQESLVKNARVLERSLSVLGSLVVAPETAKGRKKLYILKVATDLFVKQGYRRTSVDQIAEEAQVAKGTVYLYFNNKADIMFNAIALEKMTFLKAGINLFRLDLPPKERLKNYLEMAIRMMAEMPLLSRLVNGDGELVQVMEELGAEWGTDFYDMQVKFVTPMVSKACKNKVEQEVIEARTRVVLSILYSSNSLLNERIRTPLTVEQFAKTLSEMLVEGI